MSRSRSPQAVRAAAALALAALLAGCADRPRSNPLDPRNPDTGGGPTGFAAVAGNNRVTLAWQAPPNPARLGGFLLERRVHGTSSYAPLVPVLTPAATGFGDSLAVNDTEYDYRLSYVLASGAVSGTQVERVARPGPEVVWVADPGVDEVVRMSPDGRARVLTLNGNVACNRIAVQLSGGEVWASSPLEGLVRVFGPDGTSRGGFSGLNEPNALAVDPTSRTAWVCEEGPPTPTARRWASDGTLGATGPAFGLPSDVAIVPGGGAWIVDELNARVLRVDFAGNVADTVHVPLDPRRIARDVLDGSVWVTCYSAGDVVHISAAGVVLATYGGFVGPYGVDVDEFRGVVWVGLDNENAVVALHTSNGTQAARAEPVSRPRSIAVNDRTGECFAAAIASHELVRIGADGTVLSRESEFDAPFDVKVDPGPR